MLRRMALKDLNPHIICVLCGGYLVDATTIVECLHSCHEGKEKYRWVNELIQIDHEGTTKVSKGQRVYTERLRRIQKYRRGNEFIPKDHEGIQKYRRLNELSPICHEGIQKYRRGNEFELDRGPIVAWLRILIRLFCPAVCRSCIVSWLQASYHCPVCDTEVHKTRPFLNIRPDCVLQDIVYKLVPGLYQRELNYREEFKTKLQENDPTRVEPKDEVKGDSNNKKHEDDVIEDPVCLTLEYYGARRNWRDQPVFPTRYLRCSSTMTIGVLKKFFLMKFSIPPSHEAEIVRSDEILSDHLSMKEVAGIYGLHSKSFIDLQYVFMAIDNDNDPDSKIPRTSLTNSGNTRLMAQISKNSARDTFTKSREKKRTARERKATLRDQHSPSHDVKNAVPRNHSNASEGPNSTSCEENIHLKNTLDPHLLSHKHLHTNESLIDRIRVEPRQGLSKYEANGTIPTMVDTFECPDTPESDKQEKFFPGEFSPSGNMEPEISTVVM
ncbi:predicted protein [Nematostella vectensis]|uniref:RAWUL domain-containing protein n=1 Tax=Nematostella vectensis TaxID=45351 RepID=A7SGY9_NEMVE|nr:predicted protein [Nematostella vectensis]|eukprot:XP_001629062.1 predicted protein [Nematostella vectensis]